MKVAILTQPLATNYGGILQAWALQQVLKGMGHSPVTVDRQYNRRAYLSGLPGKAKRLLQEAMLRFGGKTLHSHHLARIRGHQGAFIRKHISLSPRLTNDAALRQYFGENAFDAVIVGSDQVWRPWYSPRIETYFLDFVDQLPGKQPTRLAYAASFGVDSWEFSPAQMEACRALAQRFDGISVRESSAVALCREHFGVDAEWVADPTLLLGREDYIRHFCQGVEDRSRGLFTYILDGGGFKDGIVRGMEAKLGLARFRRQARAAQRVIRKQDLPDYEFPPADAWVSGFHEASFVITDSFHGTVFSLIFEKPFIAIANSERGEARFESLLGQVGMEDRLVSGSGAVDLDRLAQPLDFSLARSRLDMLREISTSFLKKHL